MAGSLACMLIVGWKMYFGHQSFLATQETSYFLGFPEATAWQTYGTWLSAIPLVLIYSIGFSQFIYSKEDEEKFTVSALRRFWASSKLIRVRVEFSKNKLTIVFP